jgi:hypothetical protein
MAGESRGSLISPAMVGQGADHAPPDAERKTAMTDNAAEELAETEEEKESQVLKREPVEAELMDEDRSEVGEQVEGVQDE